MRNCRHTLFCCVAAVGFAQPGAVVTETHQVRIDGKMQTVRKINGRYWSPDNRELSRTNTNWLWSISGGNAIHLVRFDHHRPLDPARVALVDRSMGPDQVRGVLGPPNSVFPSDRPEQQQHWDYYGSGGYKLSIQFASTGTGIFNASYCPDAKSMPQDVPHLAFRFEGKTARERMAEPPPASTAGTHAERVAQMRERMAARRAGVTSGPAPTSTTVVSADVMRDSTPPPPTRKVTDAELQTLVVGMPRAKVIEVLGEPVSGFSIAGSEGTRETLEYSHERGTRVRVVLVAGKVAELPKK